MHSPIILVAANEVQRRELCEILQRNHYKCIALTSLEELEREFQTRDSGVVILDLDTLPVDNRFFRKMSKRVPSIQMLGLSSRSFHPELKEAISQHICSCLLKPVEEEELLFWVRSIVNTIKNQKNC